MKNWIKFIISLVLPQITGISGAIFTETGDGSWFQTIVKPGWNPPGWVFAPVWTTLYILMGVAFYLIWKSHDPGRLKQPAMVL